MAFAGTIGRVNQQTRRQRRRCTGKQSGSSHGQEPTFTRLLKNSIICVTPSAGDERIDVMRQGHLAEAALHVRCGFIRCA